MNEVLLKSYKDIPFNYKEILRYYGNIKGDITEEFKKEVLGFKDNFIYNVLYVKLPVCIDGENIDFNSFSVKSKDLSRNLSGCKNAILFIASVGVAVDRLIKKYFLISPSKALLLQALGAERVESLCDVFCDDIKAIYPNIKTRFSAGYGDLQLAVQKDIFKTLSPNKIGVSLGNDLIMSPSKTVTAFVGICEDCNYKCLDNKCDFCSKTSCEYKNK